MSGNQIDYIPQRNVHVRTDRKRGPEYDRHQNCTILIEELPKNETEIKRGK